MKERSITVGLLNGFYKMITEGDYDLITENIMKCPMKVADPMARAILSYGYLMPDKAFSILKTTFALYSEYFMKVEPAQMEEVVKKAEAIKEKFSSPDESEYAGRMLSAFIDEIELSAEAKTDESSNESKVA